MQPVRGINQETVFQGSIGITMTLLNGHRKTKQRHPKNRHMKKQTKKSDNVLKECPKIKNVTVKEVQNVFNETAQSTVLQLDFDGIVIYMGVAEAYKLEKQLRTTLGLA